MLSKISLGNGNQLPNKRIKGFDMEDNLPNEIEIENERWARFLYKIYQKYIVQKRAKPNEITIKTDPSIINLLDTDEKHKK